MLASGMFIQHNKHLKDGLYLVEKVLYDTINVTLNANQALVHFNKELLENAPDGSVGLIINTADFVPLQLAEEPTLLPQAENQKKLQLTFSRTAAEKLESFTAKNVMKQVAMVVDGEVLTMHKIRDTIRGGKMEITGASDNVCRRIYVTLKNRHIEKSR
jgi:preprotein translocase subunit SecD